MNRFVRYALLVAMFAVWSCGALAQFQEPTKEELQMTADPKAPGAAAVYLNIEQVTNDPLHFKSFYARIKVLQDKGKELATVDLPYERRSFKVTDIKGRTIHPDGTVLPLAGKPEDLLIEKSADKQFGQKVFTLPSVEVGSILEYRYQLRYDDNQFSSPLWEIQRKFFVHKAHYSFTPFKAFQKGPQSGTSSYLVDEKGNSLNTLMWWTTLPESAQLKSDSFGTFSVDIADVPPIPDEEWMPPIHSVLYKVYFYYTYARSAADFWNAEAKRWSKDVDHFAQQSTPLRDAVSGLIAAGDSDVEKATKLYKAVQALDNTDFSREKGKSELKQLKLKVAKRAEDTWRQKSGSSDDVAMLYLAMLRSAGLTASAMKVVDRDQGLFDPGYMNFDQLDDTLVVLSTGGKEITLDPGEKMCPFGTLSWKHSGTSGARQGPESHNAETTALQAYKDNTTMRMIDVNLDEHGTMSGAYRFIMIGQEALRWRQEALENDPDEVKKKFDRWTQSMFPDGVQAHVDHFLGLDDPYTNLMAVGKVEGTLGSSTSKRLLLPGFIFESRGRQPFVDQDKRLEPVDMRYSEEITDEVTYHLPTGLVVEGAPQDTKVLWPNHALLVTKSASAPGQIAISRVFARGFTLLKAEEYADLRGFYQKVAAADQQQLVLTTQATAKGN